MARSANSHSGVRVSFQPAIRKRVPGRVGLYGVAGSGKTRTALELARGLVGPDGKISVADTEAEKALFYANDEAFSHLPINPPFSPIKVRQAIELAIKNEFDVIVIDSISHFWNGSGGVLSIVDNDKRGWAAGSPQHDLMVQAILTAQIDIVLTMRAKAETIMEKGVPKKVGMTYIQRADSLEYEMDFIGYIDLQSHAMKIEKQRGMPDLDGALVPLGGAREIGERIAAYLAGGA